MQKIISTYTGRLLHWLSGMKPNEYLIEQLTLLAPNEYISDVAYESNVRQGFVITLDCGHIETVIKGIEKDLGSLGFIFTKLPGQHAYSCVIGNTYYVIRWDDGYTPYFFESSTCSKLTKIAVPYQMSAGRILDLANHINLKDTVAFKLCLLTDIIVTGGTNDFVYVPEHQEKINAIFAFMSNKYNQGDLLEHLGEFVEYEEINDILSSR